MFLKSKLAGALCIQCDRVVVIAARDLSVLARADQLAGCLGVRCRWRRTGRPTAIQGPAPQHRDRQFRVLKLLRNGPSDSLGAGSLRHHTPWTEV